MLELLGTYLLLCFAMVVVGAITTKLTLYGGMTTLILWVSYGVLPGLSSSTVLSKMIPRFIDLWSFYPQVIASVTAEGLATHGVMGAIIYCLLAVLPFFPYVSGLVFGLFFWPELTVLRILL